jgi:hypothetical protein|tara:strand:- start:73 stop:279 length:207 start_codon:yes stop_codon:yes gene_type:complete
MSNVTEEKPIDMGLLDQAYPHRTLGGVRDIKLYADENESKVVARNIGFQDDTMELIWRDAERELERNL